MTETELVEWIQNQKNDWDVPGSAVVDNAVGFIMSDIDEHGVMGFLHLDSKVVVHNFISATASVSAGLMEQFNVAYSQQEMLDDLGISTDSEKIDVKGLVKSLKDALLDIMQSIFTYLEIQEKAYEIYYHENEN